MEWRVGAQVDKESRPTSAIVASTLLIAATGETRAACVLDSADGAAQSHDGDWLAPLPPRGTRSQHMSARYP